MLLAKKVVDLTYIGYGHITYFQHYIGNKIIGFIYARIDRSSISSESEFSINSDIKSILIDYQQKNYKISHTRIETQSLLSLLSGTTAAFLIGYAIIFLKEILVSKRLKSKEFVFPILIPTSMPEDFIMNFEQISIK